MFQIIVEKAGGSTFQTTQPGLPNGNDNWLPKL